MRCPQPSLLCTQRPPRLRVADIKRQLEAAGVSTAGIVEKEELVRLLEALPQQPMDDDAVMSLPMTQSPGPLGAAVIPHARASTLTVVVALESRAAFSSTLDFASAMSDGRPSSVSETCEAPSAAA